MKYISLLCCLFLFACTKQDPLIPKYRFGTMLRVIQPGWYYGCQGRAVRFYDGYVHYGSYYGIDAECTASDGKYSERVDLVKAENEVEEIK
jgi:hypothetical protein